MVARLVRKFERNGRVGGRVAIADAAALNLAAFRSSNKSLLRANIGFRREGYQTVNVSCSSTRHRSAGGFARCPSSSYLRLGSEDDRAMRRQHAAIAVRDRGLAISDLAGAAFAPQLPCRLDQQEQPVHAGVAIG